MKKHTLNAQKRELTGRKVKRLREDGMLPANIFGAGVDSTAITVSAEEFQKIFNEAGETSVIEVDVDGEKKPTLIHDIQLHPVTHNYLHADFLQVDLSEKVTAAVPVELAGESPAEKNNLGVVVQQLDEIEVEALPTELPDSFLVDVSELVEVDQAILVSDLKYDKSKIEIQIDTELVVAKVEPLQEEELPEPAVEAATEEEEGAAPEEEKQEQGSEEPSETKEEN